MSAFVKITFFLRPRFKCQHLSTLRYFYVHVFCISLCRKYFLCTSKFSMSAFVKITFFLRPRFKCQRLLTLRSFLSTVCMSACDNITFFFCPRFKCQPLSTSRSFSVNLLRVSLCQHYSLLFAYTFSVLAFDNITFFLHTRFALSICPLHAVSTSTFCVSAFVPRLMLPGFVCQPLSTLCSLSVHVFSWQPLSTLCSFYVHVSCVFVNIALFCTSTFCMSTLSA